MGPGARLPGVLLGNLSSSCSPSSRCVLPIPTYVLCVLGKAWHTEVIKWPHFYLGLLSKWLPILAARYISLPWPLERPYGTHIWLLSQPWHTLLWPLDPFWNKQYWPSHWWWLFLPPSGAMMPHSCRQLIAFQSPRIFWQ